MCEIQCIAMYRIQGTNGWRMAKNENKKVSNKKEQNIIIETALPQTMHKTNDDDEKS